MPRPRRRSGSDRARPIAVARIAGSERPLLGSTPMSAICALPPIGYQAFDLTTSYLTFSAPSNRRDHSMTPGYAGAGAAEPLPEVSP
jgi:hypothetical protein